MAEAPAQPASQLATILLKEISDREQFIATQAAGGISLPELLAGQSSSLTSAIAATRGLTFADAVLVGNALNTGPWSHEQKATLNRVLGDVVASASSKASPSVVRKPQNCETLQAYLPQRVWDVLESDDDLQVKCDVLGDFMYAIGLVCPDEPLLKRAGAIVQQVGLRGASLDTTSKAAICQKLQQRVKAADKAIKYPFEHRRNYPVDPMRLPSTHFNKGYPDGGPIPMDAKYVGNFATFLSGMVKRSTANPAKPRANTQLGQPAPVVAAPAAPHMGTVDGMQPMMQMFAQTMMQMMSQMGGSHTPPPAGRGGGQRGSLSNFRSRAITNGTADVGDHDESAEPAPIEDGADNIGDDAPETPPPKTLRGSSSQSLVVRGSSSQSLATSPVADAAPASALADPLSSFMSKMTMSAACSKALKGDEKKEAKAAEAASIAAAAAAAASEAQAAVGAQRATGKAGKSPSAMKSPTVASPAAKRAAVATLAKRPASAAPAQPAKVQNKTGMAPVVDDNALIEKLTAELVTAERKGNKTLHQFKSIVSKSATLAAKQAGKTDDVAKAIARVVHGKARDMYGDL